MRWRVGERKIEREMEIERWREVRVIIRKVASPV